MSKRELENQISRMMDCIHTIMHELEYLMEGLIEEHAYFKKEIQERLENRNIKNQ